MRRLAVALALMGSVFSGPVHGVQAVDGCPALIEEVFGEMSQAACAVAWCESKFDETATGSAGERGWFQIHPSHGRNSSYDPLVNTMFAYQLSRHGTDWSDWARSCRPW